MSQIEEFQDLVLDALEVVEFKLIRTRSDLENAECCFHPMMAHQIFGETESIFGYKDLKVRILYSAGPLQIYLSLEYGKKVDELSKGEIKADNVVATIAEKLPDGCYFTNMEEFLKSLDTAEKFQPYGEKLYEYVYKDQDGKERIFDIYNCNYKTPSFLKFFSRLQTFVLWFVDAASYIDVDDKQWTFFVCYEKYKSDKGVYSYATVGYTTVYEYYAYPQNVRPRISQMLILPPFQNLGIGTTLLKTIYQFYQGQRHVIDITVEDPSEDFQRMRNLLDCTLCMKLKHFQKEELKKGFNKEMIKEARETLKFNPRQCRIIYEILRLIHTDIHNEDDYTSYRLDIKKRLNAPYYKQLNDMKKMEKAKVDTTWLAIRLPSTKIRIEQLQDEYKELEMQYKLVIEKVQAL